MTADDLRTLRDVRRVVRHRSRARPFSDVATTVYGVFLSTLVCGAPLVRALVIGMSAAGPQAALAAFVSAGGAAAVAAGALVLFAALGPVRGAAVPPPALADVAANGGLPRRLVLAAPFAGWGFAVTVAGAIIAAVVAGTLLAAGGTGLAGMATLALSGAMLGALLVAVQLIGQRLPERFDWTVPMAVALLAALTWLAPPLRPATPWWAVEALWSTVLAHTGSVGVPLIVLAVWVAVGAVAAPLLTDAVPGPAISRQAARWERAGAAVGALDGAGALGAFRQPPRWGRRWWAVRRLPLPLLFVVLDAVATLRRPIIAAISVAAFVAAGALVAVGTPLTAGGAAIVAIAAIPGLATGLRDAGNQALGPALHGTPPGRLIALHATWPFVVAVTAALTGAVLVGATMQSIVAVVALAALVVAAESATSVKGTLPTQLLMPIASEVGDPSVFLIILWQLDAAVIVTGTALVAGWLLGPGGPVMAAAVTLAGVGLLLLMALVRLRRA